MRRQVAKPCSLRRARAFTLVEMLAVGIILALIAALALPAADRWSPAYRLRAAALAVERRLALARALALEHDRAYRVCYDLDKAETWAEPAEPDGEPVERERLPEGVRFERVETAAVEAREGVVAVEVRPSGLVEPHAVALAMSSGAGALVRADPLGAGVLVEGKEE